MEGFNGPFAIFSWILKEDLNDSELPVGLILVQYVDNLFLTPSRNCSYCLKDIKHLCTALATKLQLCQIGVKYLQFVLKEGQQVIDTERVKV